MNQEHDELVDYFRTNFGFGLEDIYWGEFHAHTFYSFDAYKIDAARPDWALKYATSVSDEIGGPDLDFLALNDHAELINFHVLPELRKQYSDAVDPIWESTLDFLEKACVERAKDKRDIFIAFPGWEYTNSAGMPVIGGSRVGYGHKNVVFRSLDREALPDARYGAAALDERYHENFARTSRELWKLLDPYRPKRPGDVGDALTIMHTPAKEGTSTNDHSSDIQMMDPDFVRNLEIYSQHGNSEGPCPDPRCDCEPDGIFNDIAANERRKTARSFLTRKWCERGDPNYILSFLAGTDNHLGRPGTITYQHEAGGAGRIVEKAKQHIMDYWGGKAGVVARRKTRNSIWESLWNRHTLGTSGHKIQVLFSVQVGDRHLFMGDHLASLADAEPSTDGMVRIRLRAVAYPEVREHNVAKLEVIRNGCMWKEVPGAELDLELDDLDPTKRHFIYVRAVLDDGGRRPGEHDAPRRPKPGNRAWTSPVYLGKPSSDRSRE